MAKHLFNYMRFFREGLLRSQQMGAILPSQRFLVEQMIAPIPLDHSGRILELGAGNGALTLRLALRCPRANITACEINPTLARDLRVNLDSAGINGQVEVVSDAAERLLGKLSQGGEPKPQFIISGIPLGNVPRARTVALIQLIEQSLAKGGMYIQFQHSLVDRRKIQASFSALRTVPVLLNIPPAFVYYARK